MANEVLLGISNIRENLAFDIASSEEPDSFELSFETETIF